MATFIGGKPSEVIWTTGTTHALNLLAHVGGAVLTSGDVVLVSVLEHHSSLLPWVQVAQARGAEIVTVSVDTMGKVCLQEVQRWMDTGRVRVVVCTLVSNVLGTRQPVEEIVEMAHSVGARVVVDAAQGAAHMPIDVEQLGMDALIFGGHKVYGPAGVGVLWANPSWMSLWEPLMLGGGMAMNVASNTYEMLDPPHRFEAGTPRCVCHGWIGDCHRMAE